MIKGILAFLILTVLIHLGISGFRKLHKLEKWNVVKTLTYSAVVALIAVSALVAIVVLF